MYDTVWLHVKNRVEIQIPKEKRLKHTSVRKNEKRIQ